MSKIHEYNMQSIKYALAVQAWSKGFDYDDYVSLCESFKVQPIDSSKYSVVCDDCEEQMNTDLNF